MRALIAGASGFVGRRLAPALIERGVAVRCLVRDPLDDAARELSRARLRAAARRRHRRPISLEAVAAGVDVAYYLVHLMADDEDALARARARLRRRVRARVPPSRRRAR